MLFVDSSYLRPAEPLLHLRDSFLHIWVILSPPDPFAPPAFLRVCIVRSPGLVLQVSLLSSQIIKL